MDPNKRQPDPVVGQVDVYPLVIRDIADRALSGKRTYGTYLQTHNGRDALLDAYQEALDLALYLRQLIAEKQGEE
jgi:hypothetical protein